MVDGAPTAPIRNLLCRGEGEEGGSLACGQSEDVDIKLLRLRRLGAAPLITMWSCNPATSLVFSLATSHQPPDCLMFIAVL